MMHISFTFFILISNISLFLISLRERKLKLLIENKKAITIQASIRRFLTRSKFLKKQKRLIRDRKARLAKKNAQSAVTVQKIIRSHLSKRIVNARKAEKLEEEKTLRKFADFESKLDGKLLLATHIVQVKFLFYFYFLFFSLI